MSALHFTAALDMAISLIMLSRASVLLGPLDKGISAHMGFFFG
jgi:hypothetical protein